MHSVTPFLMVLACVLFFIAGMWPWFNPPAAGTSKLNLVAWGLFAWCLATTLGMWK